MISTIEHVSMDENMASKEVALIIRRQQDVFFGYDFLINKYSVNHSLTLMHVLFYDILSYFQISQQSNALK